MTIPPIQLQPLSQRAIEVEYMGSTPPIVLTAGQRGRDAFDYAPNWTDDGDVYIPAYEAMTIDQGNDPIGAGSLSFAKSTAAAPSSFTATSLPAAIEAGAWLRVIATGVNGFLAAHLRRTA